MVRKVCQQNNFVLRYGQITKQFCTGAGMNRLDPEECKEISRAALRKAISLFEHQEAFAVALTEHISSGLYFDKPTITQQVVSYWLAKSKYGVPAELCIPIFMMCRDLGETITLADLRPDLFAALTEAAE